MTMPAPLRPDGHTPGPWGIEQTSETLWVGPLRQDGRKVDRVVVGLGIDREMTAEAALRQYRNACLIAAAPQLLEALKHARRIIDDIDQYMKRPERGDWGAECACCMGELLDDDRATLVTIDAAIARAEPQP